MKIINIIAFCLPLEIFFFWGIIGYSALSILRTQRNMLQNLLLAPTVGIAITLLPIFLINRLGVPIGNFATPLTLILVLISISFLLWKKPFFPYKYYFPFIGVFVFALWLTGRPLLKFGFNWISYANDDMANYCLSALRFLHYGYFDAPKVEDILSNRDYSLYYWFMHVANMTRSGADLLLAWLSGLTKLTPLQIFMPLILAFHLSLISATAGMVYQNRSYRNSAIAACILITCSPLTSLGTLYQLIAQVLGISLLIVAAIFILQPFNIHQKYLPARLSILISIILAALLISYPEVVPFLFLGIMFYFLLNLLQGWRPRKNFWLTIAFCLMGILLFLNVYWINIYIFLKNQATLGISAKNIDLFPYFLLPSGLANILGILPIGTIIKEPWQSLAICLASILLIFTIGISILLILKKKYQSIVTIFLVMLGISVFLFIQNSGFGLFKLAMYIQPFLISIIALLLFNFFKNIYRTTYILLIIILLTTQTSYLKFSYGDIGSSFVELPNASKSNLLYELKVLVESISKRKQIFIDVHSVVPAKLIALYFSGNEIIFYSNYFMYKIVQNNILKNNSFRLINSVAATLSYADYLKENLSKKYVNLNFSLHNKENLNLTNSFNELLATASKDSVMILSTPNRTILNHRRFLEHTDKNFIALPLNKVSNHLIFKKSSLGQDYYLGDAAHISIRNFEGDYFYKNSGISGLGQYLLFQIINPTQKIRFALNITKTNTHERNNLLPSAVVIGENRQLLPIIGRGSARVFSPPINPQMISGNPYIMLDLGENGKPSRGIRQGLMKLYGTNINLDSRLINSYARDISLISEEEYENLSAPDSISHFPTDLANPDLEYSGIYEDGWVSDASYFKLMQSNNNPTLIIRGHIPMITKPFNTNLTIYIDDKKIAAKHLAEGDFTIQIPVVYTSGRRKVELRFSRTQDLPNGDDRAVAAMINFIGFTKIT